MAQALPTGTVTFLFSDVEGSTRKLEEVGAERYADALGEHRRLLREAFDRHGGVEVDTQGDAFFVAFPTAQAAVLAAADGQRALAETNLRVRIGLHSGEASATGDGYVGMEVHRAARICSAAHGGQVILSQATRELVEAALPDELAVRDLGEHRLKDLTRPQRLSQLLIAGLASEFPPLRTLEQHPTNLPVQQAPLVGRERELREADELLSRTRLLTLTGPGGSGKTRLALQLAADALDDYVDGVFFVELSDLVDPALVVPTVAETLGIRERGGVELGHAVAEHLVGKQMLVVLDNVEQVLGAAPHVSRWTAAGSAAKVLATGRAALRVSGEQEYPVPPLPPAAAVELFTERARAVRPDFALDGNRAAVAEICARLDSLPLAIELAAARVKLLPPPKLLERLDQRLPILTTGARDAPARHQTLRAAIDWSFDLLNEEEQTLFARLSVFAGGFTLEAAEGVCDASIDNLASLVENSLLVQHEAALGDARFAMLETVREYAREHLDRRGEESTLADRHARYFQSLAGGVAAGAPDEDPDLGRRLLAELDNFRRAHAWLVASGDVERELEFATGVLWTLWTQANLRELHGWLASALDRGTEVDPWLRTKGLGAAALAAANSGERELAREYASESLALARALGDKRQIEWALRVLCFDEPDLEKRRRLLNECEQLLQEVGNEAGLAWVTYLLGQTFADEGDFDRSCNTFEEAAGVFNRLGRRWDAANAEVAAAFALIAGGRPAAAQAIVERTLRLSSELGSLALAVESLAAIGMLRAASDPATAARIFAAAQTLADEGGYPLSVEFQRAMIEHAVRRARDHLAGRFADEWEAGRALTLEEAIALALGEK